MSEPVWFTALLDQRQALIEDKIGKLPKQQQTMLMTPLTEPHPGMSFAQWERSCDYCKKFCPGEDSFMAGAKIIHLRNGMPVTITFGLCRKHGEEYNRAVQM